MFLRRLQLVSKTDNLNNIYELSRQCGILNISKPNRPSWPVTWIALLLLFGKCNERESAMLKELQVLLLQQLHDSTSSNIQMLLIISILL
jgi:hypothetical protein